MEENPTEKLIIYRWPLHTAFTHSRRTSYFQSLKSSHTVISYFFRVQFGIILRYIIRFNSWFPLELS